jgi:predicted transcriptional regulator
VLPRRLRDRTVSDDSDIPLAVRRFIADHLHSIEQLEVLLLLHRTTPASWTATAISTELRSSASSVAQRLESLLAGRLVERLYGDVYRFAAEHPGVGEAVRELADAYRVRRYTVIDLIARNRHVSR